MTLLTFGMLERGGARRWIKVNKRRKQEARTVDDGGWGKRR